ncbi:MAG: S8 family serine peptidase [Chitinophagaceae bacterium]|nr:S8 family serine peptidase [Chitinophagaceae bacterium]
MASKRINPIPLITFSVLLAIQSFAQDGLSPVIRLKSGNIIPEKNITKQLLSGLDGKTARWNGQSIYLFQFNQIPAAKTISLLKDAGVHLLDFIPGSAYTVSVTAPLDSARLTAAGVIAVIALTPEQKMQPELAAGNFPAHAVKQPGSIDCWISFPATYTVGEVSQALRQHNFDIQSLLYSPYRIIAVRLSTARLRELASFPFIEYVEPAPGEDQPLNNKSTANARANILSSSFGSGRNLRGSGVTIGIGDNADPLRHVDLSGRIINRNSLSFGSHGVHVMGIAGGGGIVEEKFTGFAPKARIVSQAFSNILLYAPAYVQDFGMVITNNSYGNIVNECDYMGLYDLYARVLDQQAFQMPSLQNIFSAGNSGAMTCFGLPQGYRTVLGGYQSAKNVITVGNTTELGDIITASSKGPVKDGRLKPEIVAQGTNVMSSWPINIYSYNTGTSMSSPAVAGGMALLYEKYKIMHSGTNPQSALMKALVCNGGTDDNITPGPDYAYGFGWMNLLRSVTMLENNLYFNDSVANNQANTHNITVSANTARLKVMLYWNDPAASVLAATTLVNDLDLKVTDPSSNVSLPLVLDANNVLAAAVQGRDSLNNIEQVVITNPPAGVYTLEVNGKAVTQNPRQPYFLVFDTMAISSNLTYPMGGEHVVAGDSVYISWDSWGDPANSFTLEYSTDNGGNWTLINGSVSATLRQYKWFIPNVNTSTALVRLTRNGTSIVSTSGAFTIVGVPNVQLAPVQCEGYISIYWLPVNGVTNYEVMWLNGDEMVHVANTTDTFYVFSGLSKDSTYWVAVRSIFNGSPGRRSTGISRQPNNGACTGSISDNDIKVDAILSPLYSGRLLTSNTLSGTQPIGIRIKNLDDVPTAGNITATYRINGGAPVNEVITAPAIAAGGTLNYTFTATANMLPAGIYDLEVSVAQTGDNVTANNTLTKRFKQLNNPAITLVTPFVDDIETGVDSSYLLPRVGLEGLDRYDFSTNTVNGRVRTFINTGIAHSGSKALTLDADRFNGGTVDTLTGTFNLTGFNPATDDIRLDFHYKNHGQTNIFANKLWVRGDDTQNWIQAYDLYLNQNPTDGSYKKTASIELSDLLATAAPAQTYSSSFQLRWGQFGQFQASGDDGGAGYTFDDIRLYKVTDDIQMVSIDTPAVSGCALSATTPVRITIRNSSGTAVNNVPVNFRVDGGAWSADEFVPTVAANANAVYTFTATANLAALGTHLLETRIVYPTDSYNENDTASITLNNAPVISSFPYLENFESGAGFWYADGKNNSWEYGTPASNRISRAASGTKAWKTSLVGNYNDAEKSYLYSPCFNISGLTNPTLSLSLALDLEDCGGTACDGAYVEYTSDGKTWNRLGANGQGTNWYNKAYTNNNLWSVQFYQRWHVATIPLPTGITNLRLRFVVSSDASLNRDGVGIDDIHIYDNIYGIYSGVTMGAPVTQVINTGTNTWVDFLQAGQLVASVHPEGQEMGSTDAQAYIFTGPVRTNSGQYYHNRNITIQPPTPFLSLADSVRVRFYFLDSETELLINAAGCGTCYKPTMAYELGVTKYSDPDNNFENGTLLDNVQGVYTYINANKSTFVPFDKGYYTEFKVNNFSEFWLNNGGFDRNQPLPVKLLAFDAVKSGSNNVLNSWIVTAETGVSYYEVQVARGNTEYQQNRFISIGRLNSAGISTGNQSYSYTDIEANKSGVRYYRLKIVNQDGSIQYSAVKAVIFTGEFIWTINPNPSNGVFHVSFQATAGNDMQCRLMDVNGKVLKQFRQPVTGFIQKFSLDMQSPAFATGMYFLELKSGEQQQIFRLVKQ